MTHGHAFVDDLVPFLAMDVMERGMAMVRAGEDVVQMGVGEPDFDPPACAVEAAVAALRTGRTHYTDSRGLHPLRVAIAADARSRFGVDVHEDQVLVTMGTSPALRMVIASLLAPGDEVIVPTPHYPCYPNMIRAAGGVPVYVPTDPSDGYLVDPERVRAAMTPRTRAVLLGSPSNPTGGVQPMAVVRALATLGVPLLWDAIYDGLLYDGATAPTPLGLSDDVYVFDGVSKRYAMTGFRIGWVIAPATAMRGLVTMQQNFYISAPEPNQLAALAALEAGAEAQQAMRSVYARRRDVVVDGLARLRLPLAVPPAGAFYALADAQEFMDDSLAHAFHVLDRAKVALGPGRDFGEAAEGYLRFSFATAESRLLEGLTRLERHFEAERLARAGRPVPR